MSDDKKFSAQEAAVAVLAKAEQMLKDSKLAKSDEDRSKMSGKTGMVRGTTESNLNQKGVNQLGNNGSSGGMSEAGNAVRNSAHSSGSAKAKYQAHAKEHHGETLAAIKAMPKPNLTKGDKFYHPKDENPLDTSLLSNTRQTPEPKKDPVPMDTSLLSNTKKPKMKKAEPVGEMHPKEKMQGEAEKPAERVEEQMSPEANPKEQAEGNNPEWGNEPGNYKLAKFCGHMSAKRKMRG